MEVRPKAEAGDPRAQAVQARAGLEGVAVRSVRTARVYLIEGPLTPSDVDVLRHSLLTDPVIEESQQGVAEPRPGAAVIEVHPLPGVMDPVAQSVEQAIAELLAVRCRVSTAVRYDLEGLDEAQACRLARRMLANPVVHAIHTRPYWPDALPRGRERPFELVRVPLRECDDAALERLSRSAHLFLSLEEMRAVREHYRSRQREPTDIELETIAQAWSEHCVHKTIRAPIVYRAPAWGDDPIVWDGRPGHRVVRHADGSVEVHIGNLLRDTIMAATNELIAQGLDWALSVFVDNSGVIALDDRWAVCVKVETHNHPSAIEPYGGAATGVGGCIRDIIGTGLSARPVASTDVFCVAFPGGTNEASLPPGVLPPRRVLTDVVAGVRDYGNRMGIPTLAGAVAFDDRYVANPLVFCGCVGLLPRYGVRGQVQPGDRIVVVGGRTGRDGIHGATFSSAELEHTAADEFAHAVQIGNPIEQKRLLDAILRARDEPGGPLFSAITDCGAGGFSSAIGEMGRHLGACVHLDRAPLKYEGLTYREIWISEAQERMILAVPPANLDRLHAICAEEGVESADLGHFGTPGRDLVLVYRGQDVGRVDLEFLHGGLPRPVREATWSPPAARPAVRSAPASATPSMDRLLLMLLAHPDIASRHWIVRQYDHEVQGNTVLKPLVGPGGRGHGDAAVIEPVPGTGLGVAIACGLQIRMGDPAVGGDPYLMALAAVDECVRNLVCVGADPERIAMLDNFCWPACASPRHLGALVRAAEGCRDAALAYRTPFISGKDSLNNQFRYFDPRTGQLRTIEIPYTLLITGVGLVPGLERCTTMDAKQSGHVLVLVGRPASSLGGSCVQPLLSVCAEPCAADGVEHAGAEAGDASVPGPGAVPRLDPVHGAAVARAVASAIAAGIVRAAHDVSDGGLLVAIAEMLIAADGTLGAEVILPTVASGNGSGDRQWDRVAAAFGESPAQYVLEIAPADLPALGEILGAVSWVPVGTLNSDGRLRVAGTDIDRAVEDLARAWRTPLDW